MYKGVGVFFFFPIEKIRLRKPILKRMFVKIVECKINSAREMSREFTFLMSVSNSGSNCRDFCMLERNILSHLRLAFLLSLLSSSILLKTRLVPPNNSENYDSNAGIPLASIQLVAALAAIAAGCWEYYSGCKDLRNMRAFLVATK